MRVYRGFLHLLWIVAALDAAGPDQAFGPFTINDCEQFAQSKHSFAFVNLKPIVKGHVLICPRRILPRFTDLTSDEVADLWQLAQKVGGVLEQRLGASALTLAIQDGECAGQSVPHVHVHCLPRRKGDFKRMDDVYEALDSPENSQIARGTQVDAEAGRKPRSKDEMAEEAAEFRAWFPG